MYESGKTHSTPGSPSKQKSSRQLDISFFHYLLTLIAQWYGYLPLNFSDVSSDTVHWNPVYVVVLNAYMFFFASSMLAFKIINKIIEALTDTFTFR